MICKAGEIISIPINVKIIAPFAHQDRIYYVAKPVSSRADTIWIISTDGELLDVTEEIMERASQALLRVSE